MRSKRAIRTARSNRRAERGKAPSRVAWILLALGCGGCGRIGFDLLGEDAGQVLTTTDGARSTPFDGGPSDASRLGDASSGCTLSNTHYAVGETARLSGTLLITAAQSARCATVDVCNYDRGHSISQKTCDFSPCQLWEPLDLGNDFYAFRNAGTGHCMDLDNGATSRGTGVVQWDCYFPTTQHFQAICKGGDAWSFVNRASMLLTTVDTTSNIEGARFIEEPDQGPAGQRFRIEMRTGVFSPIVATGETGPNTAWRYTTTNPGSGWQSPDFDDSAWSQGPGGFGDGVGGQAVVRTPWTGIDIWLRVEFTLSDPVPSSLSLRVFHDEDVQVFLNGVLAFNGPGWEAGYLQVTPEARALSTLTAGSNLLAVHGHNVNFPQFVDVGFGIYEWPRN